MVTSEREFSNKCIWVSFVMAFFVLYIHADNLKEFALAESTTSLDYILFHILARGIGGVAVPFFFMMSGYWFFHFDIHSNDTKSKIISKLKSRIKTLLIPYLLWNTFGMVFYMVLTRMPFAVSMMNASETIPINAETIMNGVLFHANYFTFWYLKDLLVLMPFTPLILLGLRNRISSQVCLILIGLACCFKLNIHIFQVQSLFFFTLGGYLSVNLRNKFELRTSKKLSLVSLLVFIGLGFIRYFKIPFAETLALLISPLFLWNLFDLFHIKKIRWLYQQSFFIYAAHAIPVTVVMKVLAKIVGGGMPEYLAAAAYLITPWITLGILSVVAVTLNRYTPKFYCLICGNR